MPNQHEQTEPLPFGVKSDGYMGLKALAGYSGMSVRTLRNWIHHPLRPLPYYRIGGKLLVRRSDYDSWAEGFREVTPSSLDDIVGDVMKGL